MTIRINTQNITLAPDVQAYIEEKINKVTHILEPLGAYVRITKNTHHRKGNVLSMEVELHVPKKIIKATVQNFSDIHAGVDLVREKLRKQISKYKARTKSSGTKRLNQ
ncbi:MAG: ribosomal subunit interface protein [Candidatus Jacksonbacteria bacterium RIFOXYC2_FULL_44_29]|nr:MAG: hypothetical protein UV19_C0013G0005 [Parcubacteria group bacterium GW2011_GWA2_42_28]KKT54186.1 MAG: hypothetical protein UW45_C0017G0005 [Parcubacteria group bacterium GW2011_GWC2_44_22]OGY74803.1 MAG: ribosomal subunit interface protein [Candidatus Jacksonbacteria bacterium RIFOXYA2_FULL_43_12]OGY77760.1 MAG: ribosomal subunit interface protein [Candidatus Jacksonbacteria bacterium RIFOXYB2_FULL_44_15]OGY78281.1 MAG: ribosomal subunit interface protein [Candidatus Jacksonbacteria bac